MLSAPNHGESPEVLIKKQARGPVRLTPPLHPLVCAYMQPRSSKMEPLEEMALKRDVGVLIQQCQVRRALGALLGRVEGAAEREPVHPSGS